MTSPTPVARWDVEAYLPAAVLDEITDVRIEHPRWVIKEARQRKLIRTLVIVAVAVFLVLLFVAWRNVSSRADKRETAPVQIPSKVDMSKKPAPKPVEPAK